MSGVSGGGGGNHTRGWNQGSGVILSAMLADANEARLHMHAWGVTEANGASGSTPGSSLKGVSARRELIGEASGVVTWR